MTREEAKRYIIQHCNPDYPNGSTEWETAMNMAIEALQQPKIVRCRDCKYYIPYDWIFDGWTRSSNINDYSQDEIGCAVNEHNYPPEGFCSFAERKEGEAND